MKLDILLKITRWLRSILYEAMTIIKCSNILWSILIGVQFLKKRSPVKWLKILWTCIPLFGMDNEITQWYFNAKIKRFYPASYLLPKDQ